MLYQLLRACDDDDDVVHLHINLNMKWLETHYAGSASMAQSWSCVGG